MTAPNRDTNHRKSQPAYSGEDPTRDGYGSSSSSTSSSSSSSTSSSSSSPTQESMGAGVWTKEEHGRFLDAIQMYPSGPWKLVAAIVGTRTVRQTMTHAQKYRQKTARRLRGLRTKQALMRMHFGHRVSEESLMQERLRALGMLPRGRYRTPQPAEASPVASLPPSPAPPSAPSRDQLTQRAGTARERPAPRATAKTVHAPPSAPMAVESPPAVDAFALTLDDQHLLAELVAGPSLEECASVLMDLLF